jgi:ABC-type dipeptide/oligopeptide/nickel transport system permease component
MTTYVLRRLLLMIPTLIGVSFLLFMLIALSPGGVGAALRVAGGGATEATNRAVQEAYLEDRYGLDAPVVVQYVRWLARISPVKFGQRDQLQPDGTRVSPPKAIPEPPHWKLFASELPVAGVSGSMLDADADAGANEQARQLAYRKALDDYSQKRASFVAARALCKEELGRFLASEAVGRRDAVTARGDPIAGRIADWKPDTSMPGWGVVRAAGERMLATYASAVESRARLCEVFDTGPYPQSGVALIPGVISLATPDLGTSFSRGTPVTSLIANALPVTLTLNLIAFPIIYAIAIPMGIAAATKKGTWIDTGTGTLAVALWSVPAVWAGVMAIGFLANDQFLGGFPVAGLHDNDAAGMTFLPSTVDGVWQRGYLLDMLWHTVLPVACLVYGGFAILSKQTRAAMLENFSADYVRTAKAKGVAGSTIVFAHVFRNSLLPLITMFATIFPAMLAGSVVIERIFSIPGMGSLIIEAINLKDRELLLANVVIVALVNMLALLLADILYAAADPRVSYS